MRIKATDYAGKGGVIPTSEYYISAAGEKWAKIALSVPRGDIDIELTRTEALRLSRELEKAVANLDGYKLGEDRLRYTEEYNQGELTIWDEEALIGLRFTYREDIRRDNSTIIILDKKLKETDEGMQYLEEATIKLLDYASKKYPAN